MNYDELKMIIDHLHDEVMVYDDKYNLIYVNEASARHYGLKPEELIGKNFHEMDEVFWGNSTLPEVYKTKKMVAKRQITNLGQDIITIAVPVFDEHHQIKYVAQNVNDIYEINKINAAEQNSVQVLHSNGEKITPFFGKNKRMSENLEMIEKLKDIDSPCFIHGETGTGKSFIVKYMHSISNRKKKAFVTINCACIQPNLMESELFGYKKGAFSGASTSGKKGLVEVADGGILFLDEISEIPYDLQAKLLLFLQDKEFIPVGGEKKRKVDVRIIAASNRNLKQMVDSGSFREDLYFRLNTFEMTMPPLRERRDDIDGFIDYYLVMYNEMYHKNHTLTEKARHVLKNYSWPGNLRELAHIIEKVVVLANDKEIDTKDLPKSIFDLNEDLELKSDKMEALESGKTLAEALEDIERKMILGAYEKYKNSVQVAKVLGISQPKAYRLMAKYIPGYRK